MYEFKVTFSMVQQYVITIEAENEDEAKTIADAKFDDIISDNNDYIIEHELDVEQISF